MRAREHVCRGLRTLRRSSSRTRFTRVPRYLVDLPGQLYEARTGGRD